MPAAPVAPVSPVSPVHDPAGGPPRPVSDDAPLFSPSQLAAAAALGTPLTAGLLWAWNARVLGRRAWPGLAGGLLVMVASVLVVFAAADGLGVALVLAAWPLSGFVAGRVAFGLDVVTRPQRSSGYVFAGVVLLWASLHQAQAFLAEQGIRAPGPSDVNVAVAGRAGRVVVRGGDAVVRADAQAAAEALHAAGLDKQAPLLVTLSNAGPELVLSLRVPLINDAVLAGARPLGKVVAEALSRCVKTTLVRPDTDGDDVLASMTTCPAGAPAP